MSKKKINKEQNCCEGFTFVCNQNDRCKCECKCDCDCCKPIKKK